MTWNLIRNWRIESTDILLKLVKDYFKVISSHIELFLGWLYGLFSHNYPVTYSFNGFSLDLRRKNITRILSRNWRFESTDILLKLGKGYFKSISSHIEYILGWLYGLSSNNYPVTYSFIGDFLELRYQNIIWYLVRNWRFESRDILLKLGTGHFKSYRIAFRVPLWLVF